MPSPRALPVPFLLAAGFLSLTIGMGLGRFLFTPILPLMQEAEGFGPDIAGWLGAVNFTGYLAGSLLMSLVTREPLRRRVFHTGLVTSIATTFAMGLTGSLAAWLAIRFVSGIASAICLILATGYVIEALARTGQQRRAGWLWGGVGFGIAVSGLLVRLGSDMLAWPELWLVAGGLCLMALPVAWQASAPVQPSALAPHAALRMPRPFPFGPLLLAYFCEGLGYSVFVTFIVAILKAQPALTNIADYAWVLVGASAVPSCLFAAWLGERIGVALTLTWAYALQVVAVVLPVVSPTPAGALIAAALFGGTFMSISLLTMPLGRGGGGGRGIALLTAIFGVGQIIGPLGAGYLAAAGGGFAPALLASGAVVTLGGGFMIHGMRRRATAT